MFTAVDEDLLLTIFYLIVIIFNNRYLSVTEAFEGWTGSGATLLLFPRHSEYRSFLLVLVLVFFFS